ncbi:MAG TPA: tetratricopeptide repeat protein, partial [Candidatus Bathyarchaeia archaeon]|nr:tetratricopeptide repeat protein [Candidatus Bathyarchaeia archaeon]
MKHSFETPLRAAALALLLAAGCAKTHVVPAGEFADKRAVVDARVNAALDGRRFEEALGIADSLIAAGLDDSRSLAERAQALAGLGRETEAIAAFEQALLKDSGSCEHHLQFATYLMRIGKSGRADTEFTEARRLCPGSYSPLIYRNLAVSAIKLGKSGLAEEYVKEGLLSSPDDPYLSGLKAMLIAREHPV